MTMDVADQILDELVALDAKIIYDDHPATPR